MHKRYFGCINFVQSFYKMYLDWYNPKMDEQRILINDHSAAVNPRNGKAAARDFDEVMGRKKEAFLRIDHLSKSYFEGGQQRLIFQNLSLELKHGEILAILGKSGSGKTTLLNLISGIDRADGGEIYFDGVRLTGMGEHELTMLRRQKIGFVFQFFNLIPTLSVWENIILPLELNGLNNAAGLARADNLLAMVGLLNRKEAFPDRLSGGEQQRVSLARALVHDPILVLADEPTGNLDEATGRQVLKLLENLTRQAGKSLIMVTHSTEAAAIADRKFSLHNGCLEEMA